jgi:hypothetical protein
MTARFALLGAVLVASCAKSKDDGATPPPSAEKVVAWTAIAGTPRPGPHESRLVDVDLQLTVTGGWHVYSLTQLEGGPTPMSVTVSPPYTLASIVTGPRAVKAKDSNFGIETETYSGEQIFKFSVELPNKQLDVPPVELKVRSQACSDNLCLPAKTTTLTVTPGMSTT